MKVIFLDIDGVLNTGKYITWLFEVKKQPISGKRIPLDPDAVLNLNMLTMFPNTFIVVSSTWRFGENILSMQKILSDNGVRGQVYGLTPQYEQQYLPGQSGFLRSGTEGLLGGLGYGLGSGGFNPISWIKGLFTK